MNRPLKIILSIAALLALIMMAQVAIKKWYWGPRAELMSSITKTSGQLTNYRKAQSDHQHVNQKIDEIIDRTLGGDFETVDHKLRSRLNRLAESAQLQSHKVDTAGAGKKKPSPAKLLFSRSASQAALRDELDFVEHEAWLSGSGTFEQVLRLVDGIEAEPWIKRIDQLKLDPKDNGGRFDVTVRLTTLFLPKRIPAASTNPSIAPAANRAGGRGDRYQTLLELQPFRVPPPPAAPVLAPPLLSDSVAEAVAATFAYEQWILTGITHSPKGTEVWLLNQQTHESLHVGIGEKLHEAEFVAAEGDAAVFCLGPQRFRVLVGKNLSDRVPINQ